MRIKIYKDLGIEENIINDVIKEVEKYTHFEKWKIEYYGDINELERCNTDSYIIITELREDNSELIDEMVRLKNINPFIEIVLISNRKNKKHWSDAFEAWASYLYVYDEMEVDKLGNALYRCLKLLKHGEEEVVSFKCGAEKLTTKVDNILYFSVVNRIVTVHLVSGEEFSFYTTIGNIENQMVSSGNGFVRCSKSYVISVNKIYKLYTTELKLTDGTKIPIGRKYFGLVENKYNKYISGKLGH